MESREWITLLGVLITIVLGCLNLVLISKNRRNNFREKIFSIQISKIEHLIESLNQLNFEITKNANQSTQNQDFSDDFEKIALKLYNSEFILPDEIFNALFKIVEEGFVLSSPSTDYQDFKKKFEAYFLSYFNFIELFRKEYSLNKLSSENSRLYERSRFFTTLD
jgi:hypothetical protein